MKYLLKYRRQKKLMTYFFEYAMLCITKNNRGRNKRLYPLRKVTSKPLRTTCITLIAKVAKVYNVMRLNFIQHESRKFFWKNQNGFRGNWPSTSQNQTIHSAISVENIIPIIKIRSFSFFSNILCTESIHPIKKHLAFFCY